MMDWSKGYTSAFYMTIIDPATWRDIQRVDITDGNISRTENGLRESATVRCSNYELGVEKWIRLWMDVKQEGSSDHIALFTGLATSPGADMNGVRKTNTVECYSSLKTADDIKLMRGWYAPAGMSGGSVIKNLLKTNPAPVTVADNAPTLTSNIIAEDGETNLTMIEKVLAAINWRLRIVGDGSISIEPISNDPVATFDPLEFDVIETQIAVNADWFNAPNVLMATSNDITAIARDDSLTSPLSTINRGREVWAQEQSVEIASNETIESYATRRLKELQQVQKSGSYDRRFIPDIIPGDYIRMHYPKQDLDGVFKVKTQNIDMSNAGRTSENIMSEV